MMFLWKYYVFNYFNFFNFISKILVTPGIIIGKWSWPSTRWNPLPSPSWSQSFELKDKRWSRYALCINLIFHYWAWDPSCAWRFFKILMIPQWSNQNFWHGGSSIMVGQVKKKRLQKERLQLKLLTNKLRLLFYKRLGWTKFSLQEPFYSI